jgi:hypothetical protein
MAQCVRLQLRATALLLSAALSFAKQESCPALQELYIAHTPLLETSVVYLAQQDHLRINLYDADPLPAAVDVACGICAAPLLRGLAAFAKAPPTQRHITEGTHSHCVHAFTRLRLSLYIFTCRVVHQCGARARCGGAHACGAAAARHAHAQLRAQLPRCANARCAGLS